MSDDNVYVRKVPESGKTVEDFKKAQNFCTLECGNLADWTNARYKHMELLNEPVLPNQLEQVFILDLVKIETSEEPKKAFEVLLVLNASGQIFKMFVNEKERIPEGILEEFRKHFGILISLNGELTETCIAVVIHDIEKYAEHFNLSNFSNTYLIGILYYSYLICLS